MRTVTRAKLKESPFLAVVGARDTLGVVPYGAFLVPVRHTRVPLQPMKEEAEAVYPESSVLEPIVPYRSEVFIQF